MAVNHSPIQSTSLTPDQPAVQLPESSFEQTPPAFKRHQRKLFEGPRRKSTTSKEGTTAVILSAAGFPAALSGSHGAQITPSTSHESSNYDDAPNKRNRSSDIPADSTSPFFNDIPWTFDPQGTHEVKAHKPIKMLLNKVQHGATGAKMERSERKHLEQDRHIQREHRSMRRRDKANVKSGNVDQPIGVVESGEDSSSLRRMDSSASSTWKSSRSGGSKRSSFKLGMTSNNGVAVTPGLLKTSNANDLMPSTSSNTINDFDRTDSDTSIATMANSEARPTISRRPSLPRVISGQKASDDKIPHTPSTTSFTTDNNLLDLPHEDGEYISFSQVDENVDLNTAVLLSLKQTGDNDDDKNPEMVWDSVWENQRGILFFGVPRYSSSTLFPFDPAPYTRRSKTSPSTTTTSNSTSLTEQQTSTTLASFQLPDETWAWESPWVVNMSNERDCDEKGWDYNYWFRTTGWHSHLPFSGWGGWCRRRNWIRLRRRVSTPAIDDDIAEYNMMNRSDDAMLSMRRSTLTAKTAVSSLGKKRLDRERLEVCQMWLDAEEKVVFEVIQTHLTDLLGTFTHPESRKELLEIVKQARPDWKFDLDTQQQFWSNSNARATAKGKERER